MQFKHTLMSCLIVILTLCAVTLSVAAASETTPFEIAVEVSSSTAISKEPFVLRAGDTFEVSISIDSNPGICALDLRLTYDSEKLTLLKKGNDIDYVKGEAVPADLYVAEVNANKIKIYLDPQDKDFTTNGKIITLKFQVKEGIHGTTAFDVPMAYFMANKGYAIVEAEKDVVKTVNVHAFTAEPVVKTPTCTEAGSTTYTCATCSEKVVVAGADALGHDFSKEWTEDLAPTCTAEGSKSHHCTRCGEKTDVTVVEKLPHTFSAWAQVTAPSCTEKGSEKRACSVCKTEETQDIAALGHNYAADWTVDTEATCTTAGSKSKHCTRCADKSEITDIPAKGHTFSDWTVEKAATCTEAGNMKRTCSTCNEVENEAIVALGHKSANYPYVEPTKDAVGYAGGTYCTVCNLELSARTVIPMIEDNTWIYILVAVVVGVAVGGGVCAYFLIIKKKNAAK